MAKKKAQYRFPSIFAGDIFRRFGPRILNSQIQSLVLTMQVSKFAGKKSTNNEGYLYVIRLVLFSFQNPQFYTFARINKTSYIKTANNEDCLYSLVSELFDVLNWDEKRPRGYSE